MKLAEFKRELPEMKRRDSFFVTCKVPGFELDIQRYLNSGFRLVNHSMVLTCETPRNLAKPGDQHQIRRYVETDYASVLDLTLGAFTFSRFHRDQEIGIVKAEKIKQEWIISNLTSRTNTETFVVTEAKRPSNLLGYISCLTSETAFTIDLIAVKSEFRSRGLGRLLVSKAIEESIRRGHNINVGTQTDNPAVHLYESLGFSASTIESVLHYTHTWSA